MNSHYSIQTKNKHCSVILQTRRLYMAERNINLFPKTLTEIKTFLLVILHRKLPVIFNESERNNV
jgi:hypothetical protein